MLSLDKAGGNLLRKTTNNLTRDRNNCGGCHAHSQEPTDFNKTCAARPDYKVFDLTQSTPLVTTKVHDESHRKWDTEDHAGLRYEPRVKNVEYFRDIKQILDRSCTACHKVGNGEGQEYGPNLAEVGKRLTRFKIVESIIDPNAEVDPKYQSTKIVTLDGKTVTGLVVSETKKEVVIFDGKEKRTVAVDDIETRAVLKQSSMPEGQAGAMAPSEFLDLVEYLASLR